MPSYCYKFARVHKVTQLTDLYAVSAIFVTDK